MTTVYFVRHAQPNYDNHDDLSRELTPKGLQDRMKVVEILKDEPIHAVFSSPYKRAVDTVALHRVLEVHPGETVVIGTHGTALSTLVDYYRPGFGYQGFDRIRDLLPWVVRMTFDSTTCVEMTEIDL